MKKLVAAGATLALSALGVVSIGVAPLHAAATIVVTSTADTFVSTDGCTGVNPSLPCSLPEAMAAATADGDVIELQAGATYDLVGSELGHGNTALTIRGNGAVIDAQGTSRVLSQGTGTLTVENLTIANGNVHVAFDESGGGIAAQGDVTLTGSVLVGNVVSSDVGLARGGGLYAAGDVTVTGSQVLDNSLNGDGVVATKGGGIYAEGTLTANTSTFSGNAVVNGVGWGGGFWASGAVSLDDALVANNSAGLGGGGFYAAAQAQVVASTVATNAVVNTGPTSDGGGVHAEGPLSLQSSTVQGNSAGTNGGGVWTGTSVVLTDSSVTQNVANGSGGGVWAGRLVDVENSTIADNVAGTDPNADPPQAGGGAAAPQVSLRFATVAGNSAAVGGNVSAQSLQSAASVVADAAVGADCAVGATSSSGYSYDDDGSCGFTAAHDTSAGVDPMLGPLADNGGPTPTRLPAFGSPLLDAIPAGSCSGCVGADQRGIPRSQGRGYDIGAVEVVGVAVNPRFTG